MLRVFRGQDPARHAFSNRGNFWIANRATIGLVYTTAPLSINPSCGAPAPASSTRGKTLVSSKAKTPLNPVCCTPLSQRGVHSWDFLEMNPSRVRQFRREHFAGFRWCSSRNIGKIVGKYLATRQELFWKTVSGQCPYCRQSKTWFYSIRSSR